MTKIFLRELEKLRSAIIAQGEAVRDQVTDGVRAVADRDTALAERIIEGDRQIDEREVEIEEECLRVLALHQPVAQDLRLIVAVLKMNNDLERIGDKAANLAKKAKRLAALPDPGIQIGHAEMATKALAMLGDALHSLLGLDRELARDVCARDEEVNRLEDEQTAQLRAHIGRHPESAEACGLLIEVSSALERVADLATNIAEDVIYLREGEIVRHHHGEPPPASAAD
jgi:phosphate transport system protein